MQFWFVGTIPQYFNLARFSKELLIVVYSDFVLDSISTADSSGSKYPNFIHWNIMIATSHKFVSTYSHHYVTSFLTSAGG
jgi:hypothetical protein